MGSPTRDPLDGVELRIEPDGEISVRAPMLLRCYRDGEDPKTSDGWFATGDVGQMDENRLHVLGRRGELIITGGENVWPVAVERILERHPAIAEVAVVGRPDADWGQRVVAIVVPHDPTRPPTLDDLRDDVKRSCRRSRHARPRLVEALPRTASASS